MRVAVPRETAPGERRVALVPDVVQRLAAEGFEFAVERGAGEAAGFPDDAFAQAGASLAEPGAGTAGAGAVVRVAPPSADEVERLAPGSVLIGFLAPLTDTEGIQRLQARGVVAFAMSRSPASHGRSRWTHSPRRPPLPATKPSSSPQTARRRCSRC